MFTKDLGLIMETSTVNTMVSQDTHNECIHNFLNFKLLLFLEWQLVLLFLYLYTLVILLLN